MKFAIVGYSGDLLPLVTAVNDHPQHRIVANYDVVDRPSTDLMPTGTFDHHSSWEQLLHEPDADAIIVGRVEDADFQAERLRKLAQAGTPLLVLHPGCESIVGYELEMIREESHCIVVPYIPAATDPAVIQLVKWRGTLDLTESQAIEHLVVERPLVDTSRPRVLRQFAQDVSLIRLILGGVNQVTALGVAPNATSYANLNVHMQSSSGVSARWSLLPAADTSAARLMVISTSETVTLTMPSDETPWTVDQEAADSNRPLQPPTSRSAAALEAFVQTVQSKNIYLSWKDACQDVEASEVIAESLRRRRTIDLHYGEISEQSTFHGLMAIGGCALLLFSAGFLLLAGVIEGLMLPFRHHALWKIWPLYLLVLLALFLILQLLKLVFPSQSFANVSKHRAE